MDKQFVGKVEVKETQYGEMVKISFGDRDRKLLEETKNEGGWNNLVLKKNKDGKQYLEIDTWKPTMKATNHSTTAVTTGEDDLPF